jgi:putative membrane protein
MNQRSILVVAATVVIVASASIYMHNAVRADDNNANMANSPDQQKMEREFFSDAASGNTLEIRAAKLAQERSNDAQVKQAAQMMEQDHTQANQLIKQLCDQAHIDVSVDKLNAVDQAELDQLEKKQGEMFTHCFVFQQVGCHAKDELMLSYHANHGQSEACRQYASQVLPKVQMHLRALEEIARPMAGLTAQAQNSADQMPPQAH